MKHKVLFIVGDFWPTKGGGVIRVEKLAKYLPNFDCRSVVLTKKKSARAKKYEEMGATRIHIVDLDEN